MRTICRKLSLAALIVITVVLVILVPVGVCADTDTPNPITWSTTDKYGNIVLSNNNLTVNLKSNGASIRTDKSVNSGKYYWEIIFQGSTNFYSKVMTIGIAEKDISISNVNSFGKHRAYVGHTGNKQPGNIAYADIINPGDILGILLDMDNKKLSFRINDKDFGVAFTDLPSTNVSPHIFYGSENATTQITANFGAESFTYSIPDGYLPYDTSGYLLPPTNLTATAGNAKVDLTWTAAADATGYNIKRTTTSGGPYETVASAVYGTSYTDSSVEMGATYYYVVSAINESGESSNSNEAAVTIPDKPILSINAEKDTVKINDEFTVDVVLSNVTNICAEDIRISYNTELFEYLGAEPTQGLKIYNESQPAEGILRYIVASLGKDNAVTGEKALIKLKFKAKKAGADKIDIIRGRIADNGTMEVDVEESNCGDKLITVEGIKDVNRSGEFTLIDLAIDAWYYGEPVTNTDTEKYDADLSDDGLIDEVDLLMIVQEMLNNNNYTPNI